MSGVRIPSLTPLTPQVCSPAGMNGRPCCLRCPMPGKGRSRRCSRSVPAVRNPASTCMADRSAEAAQSGGRRTFLVLEQRLALNFLVLEQRLALNQPRHAECDDCQRLAPEHRVPGMPERVRCQLEQPGRNHARGNGDGTGTVDLVAKLLLIGHYLARLREKE